MAIKIVEVGPRDGLQNESSILSTDDKVIFIKMLQNAGLKEIEVGAFVRPDRIPQMGDSEEVIKRLGKLTPSIRALVPNQVGLERALKTGIKSAAFFTSVSEAFNKANINQSISESIKNFEALDFGNMKLRVYLSTVWGCPYEGKISLKKIHKMIDYFLDHDVDEISLGDTIGVGVPKKIREVFAPYKRSKNIMKKLYFHGHDTYGMAIANVCEALSLGLENFDSSAGGLGGCPYAPSSTGNLATEDLVYLLHQSGIKTSVNLEKLFDATEFLAHKLKKIPASRVFRVKRVKELNIYLGRE